MLSANTMERRLQRAGIILIAGLLVEGFSLMGHGAVAFLVFAGVGSLLLVAGIGAYLLALVGSKPAKL
jgi:hypothetical protein